jgi:Tfp pilus assembly protein PilX
VNPHNRLSHQQGYLALIAVALIVVIGFLGLAITQMFYGGTKATSDFLQADKALYLAESGLEQAAYKLSAHTLSNRTACSGLSISNTLGAGAYAVSSTASTYVSSPTTLSSALTASATTIPVASTSGYQSAGRIMIDGEAINYAAVTSTSFVSATRGVDGTTATTHSAGTHIGQYQCTLSSQGGVPSLTAPTVPNGPFGKRTLQEGVELQEAWVVGNKSGNAFILERWNNPTELSWSNAAVSSSSAQNLNDISMLSYVDGWAVGNAAEFLHWDGSTWTPSTVSPNVIYQGVFCNATDDCHAVGAPSGNVPAILHWNGSSWAHLTPSGTTGKATLQSVNCSSSSNCWAVGTNTGKAFYNWNGTSWTGVSESSLSGYTYNSVFCSASSDCWAVGANATFARYSGGSWANYATGLPAATYNSVFCNNAADCWAVGNVQGGQDLIAHWDGTSWSRNASNPAPTSNLNAVACVNSNDCWAAGSTSSGGMVHWDGNSWGAVSTSLASGLTLNAISMVGSMTQPVSGWAEVFS